jgi:ribonuclease D
MLQSLEAAAPAAAITPEEINALPLKSYEGPVHVVRSREELEKALAALRRQRVLGFDIETRPSFRKGVVYPPALVQLAGEHAAYIFQLALLPSLDGLFALLENPSIVKAGVAPGRDVRDLRTLRPLTPGGFVELESLAQSLGIRNQGLRGLAALLLGFRMSKAVRTSNWSSVHLTPQQVAYAATDAWAGREIYLKLQRAARSKGVAIPFLPPDAGEARDPKRKK